MSLVVMVYGNLALVAAASLHHFGWEGIAIPAAIWLVMPQVEVRR